MNILKNIFLRLSSGGDAPVRLDKLKSDSANEEFQRINQARWETQRQKKKIHELKEKARPRRFVIGDLEEKSSKKLYVKSRQSFTKSNEGSKENLYEYDNVVEWKRAPDVYWSGPTRKIEFTYIDQQHRRARHKLDVTSLLRDDDGHYYIVGFDHSRKTSMTFVDSGIESAILMAGIRYSVTDWLHLMLMELSKSKQGSSGRI